MLQGLALVVQLLGALGRAHAGGYCHGGLAPDCVIVGRTGLVRLLEAGPDPVPMPYVAPELCDDARADARADLYAAAMLAYEVLTGTLPFGPEARRPAWPPHAARPELPPVVDAVFRQALAQEPAFRHASAQDLSDALQAAIGAPDWDHAATAAQPVRQQPPVQRVPTAPVRTPRRRALVACAVSAAATFVIAATFFQARDAAIEVVQEEAPPAALASAAPLEPLEEVVEESVKAPVSDVPRPVEVAAMAPPPAPEPPVARTVQPEPAPPARKPARPSRERTPVHGVATRLHVVNVSSPQSQCHRPSATAREMCVALTCGTEAFRAHPTCVRLHTQAQADIRRAEQRGGS